MGIISDPAQLITIPYTIETATKRGDLEKSLQQLEMTQGIDRYLHPSKDDYVPDFSLR